MVWHAHMLNPRAYLEDATLAGRRSLWWAGMPWRLVDAAIDNADFAYTVSDTARAAWVARTGLCWDSADDPPAKLMRCPRCGEPLEIPWTTCGRPEGHSYEGGGGNGGGDANLVGHGYGDGELRHPCPGCRVVIGKELLSVAKFVGDVRALLGPRAQPMPGTVLDPTSGMPYMRPADPKKPVPQTFPNRMLKSDAKSIRTRVLGLLEPSQAPKPHSSGSLPSWFSQFMPPPGRTMHDVRRALDEVLADQESVRTIDGLPPKALAVHRPDATARLCVRKMMARYWENFGASALDLRGAVLRQGVFVEKMRTLDWLHSPVARATMGRLLVKYGRFFELMVPLQRDHVAVPTLDVDLAWHTHQLSPSAYYRHATSKTGRFIDHDDKIDEAALSEHFVWTSKAYQDCYGEVYSECTCWYCESISTPLASCRFFSGIQ